MAAISAGEIIQDRDLSGESWSGADLPSLRLEGCTVTEATFRDTVLEEARFVRCKFVRCRWSHSDLREAVFEDCQFADPEGRKGASIAFSRLEQAVFKRCDLRNARFEGAELYASRFEACNLMAAAFPKTSFGKSFGPKVIKTAVAFHDCNLELADLSAAKLGGCDLTKSRLRETDLTGADLEGADLTGADLFLAILEGAKMAGADLREAEISGFDLRALATYADIKITAAQQHLILTAMGLDVHPDPA
jgi:fluoroquinolone resistance protein